jgi:predicted transposase/invertase (TIGR01784 family)
MELVAKSETELDVITGIDPRVDIAFKKIFGTPAWSELTMSLIDAVLCPAPGGHVVQLDLLNPYSEQDSLCDKLTVLDIKARDERGRCFNVEMQMHLGRALVPRLLFYWARLYGSQLVEGDEYVVLRPTISICFVNQIMFRAREACHSVYRLLERDSQECLTEHQELHLLEIPKFHCELEALREPLDFWLYFLQNGKELDADALPGPLARPDIHKAMEVLKVFSQSELERDRYENRLKAQRDLMALKREREDAVRELEDTTRELEVATRELEVAKREREDAKREREDAKREREDAMREREDAMRKFEEVEQARNEAARKLDEAERKRKEVTLQRDLAQQELVRSGKRTLISRIQLCQKLLGQSQAIGDQLMDESLDRLQALAEQLEQQLTASL